MSIIFLPVMHFLSSLTRVNAAKLVSERYEMVHEQDIELYILLTSL